MIKEFPTTKLVPGSGYVPVTYAYDLETEEKELIAECKRLKRLGSKPLVYIRNTRGTENQLVQTAAFDWEGVKCTTRKPSIYGEIWRKA